jgi:hypothetical protein
MLSPSVSAEELALPKEGAATTIEEYLQSLSTVPNVTNRRDPFIIAAAPFDIPRPVMASGPDMSKPPLQRHPVTEYGVVATLVGDQYPRALIRLPASAGGKGSVVIVREKDRLGDQEGVIKKISSEGVLVTLREKNAMGFVKVSDALLAVGSGPGATSGQGRANPDQRPAQANPQTQAPARPFQ